MAHARMTTKTAAAATRAREARRLLFKADHPRGIDRYIDYFGGAGTAQVANDDLCGDTVLEQLA